jgi:hypothetical protein
MVVYSSYLHASYKTWTTRDLTRDGTVSRVASGSGWRYRVCVCLCMCVWMCVFLQARELSMWSGFILTCLVLACRSFRSGAGSFAPHLNQLFRAYCTYSITFSSSNIALDSHSHDSLPGILPSTLKQTHVAPLTELGSIYQLLTSCPKMSNPTNRWISVSAVRREYIQ